MAAKDPYSHAYNDDQKIIKKRPDRDGAQFHILGKGGLLMTHADGAPRVEWFSQADITAAAAYSSEYQAIERDF